MEGETDLIRADDLSVIFQVGKRLLHAVTAVHLQIKKGETLSLVGESGCGKSTLGRTLIGLYPPTNGKIEFCGVDIHSVPKKQKKELQQKMQLVFQDPYSAFDPLMSVKKILTEPLVIQGLFSPAERTKRARELLSLTGLNPESLYRYPGEFSGGQRQRLGIARALALQPELVVLDEPVSALDVSIQSQIINLLMELQESFGLTYLFIAHQLSVVKQISHRVAVMYLGRIVELAKTELLYSQPKHPYTQALLSAIPLPDPKLEKKRARIVLKGEIPSPIDPPPGCPFHTRCPFAMEICKNQMPPFKEIQSGQSVACHLYP